VGRPKLDEASTQKICDLLRAGNYLDTAATAAGVHKTTLHRWLRLGREQKRGRYKKFVEAVEKAQREAEARDVALIAKQAPTDWRAAAWRLERRAPRRYGQRVQISIEEELEAALDHLKAGLDAETYEKVLQLLSRRSGKSYGAGLYLYQQAHETPGASCLYIALTRDSAKKIMNGEFIQGRIKVDPQRCEALLNEYAGLIWDDRSAKREEHPNCPNHLTDATLYAWRFCYAYLREIPPPKPKPYTKEWFDQEMKEMGEAEVEQYLALEAERREAQEWGYGWDDPRPEPISWRSFTRRSFRS